MEFLAWLSQMRELPHYILVRGLQLTCTLLLCCVGILLYAGHPAAETAYAQHLQTCALLVMGAALIGSALMEDVLEYRGLE